MEAETQTGPTESLSVEICLQRPADASLASASRGAPGQLNIETATERAQLAEGVRPSKVQGTDRSTGSCPCAIITVFGWPKLEHVEMVGQSR